MVFCSGKPGVHLKHPAMLNNLDPIQHAVLESMNHNTVHVMYSSKNKYFVQLELTEELKTRTGLQLVPPQSHVATSSSKGDSVLIVIMTHSLTGC